jgi:hypothetical protein
VTGCCEDRTDLRVFVNGGEYLDQISDH